jgi:hypothetical protein
MYISGPDDDGERIIRKLRRGLGEGNYDFVQMISACRLTCTFSSCLERQFPLRRFSHVVA